MTEFIKLPDKTRALKTIVDTIKADAKDKFDLIIPPTEIIFNPSDSSPNTIELHRTGSPYNFSITPWALSQICQKIGVPFSYMVKCLKAGEAPLVAYNLNQWWDMYAKMAKQDAGNLYRLRGIDPTNARLRAFLSKKYSVFNDIDVLERLTSIPYVQERFYYDTFYSTEGKLIIRIVDQHTKVVDDVFVGLEIYNSEIGLSRLTVRLYLYRVACSNGMVVPLEGVTFSHAHYGIEEDDFRAGVDFIVQKIQPFVEAVTPLIQTASTTPLSMTKYMEYIKCINETFENEELTTQIINKYVDNYEKTHWGFVNAITEVAQSRPAEERIFFEEYAGTSLMLGTLPMEV